jgi:hypothetical protein
MEATETCFCALGLEDCFDANELSEEAASAKAHATILELSKSSSLKLSLQNKRLTVAVQAG